MLIETENYEPGDILLFLLYLPEISEPELKLNYGN